MELIRIESASGLRAVAGAWDDLWRRSEVAQPLTRAHLLAQWVEHFAPGRRLIALAVRQDDHLVAALPLVEGRLGGCLRVGQMATCHWASSGDLLLDGRVDSQPVLDRLVAGLAILPWPALWLDCIRVAMPRWVAFRAALARAGLPTDCRTRFAIGQIATDSDWGSYWCGLSKHHRKRIRRAERRLEAAGRAELKTYRNIPLDAVDPLLMQGFRVEDRSWKGRQGTSVVRSPGMSRFYRRQARRLAATGELELLFLHLDGHPIAFEYGYAAKGVYFSHKVGYDDRFARLGPGHLLVGRQVARCCADRTRHRIDCMGVLDAAIARWTTHGVPVGRLVVGIDRLVGPLFARSYGRYQSSALGRLRARWARRAAMREGRARRRSVGQRACRR